MGSPTATPGSPGCGCGVATAGVEAMVAARGEMIRSGDVDVILSKVEDGSIQLGD